MPWNNTHEQWGGISKLLHWGVVALVLAMAWLGLTMGDLPNGPDKAAAYALHKSLGLTTLSLVVLRLGWRLLAGAPAPVAGLPRWQARSAALIHWTLYALLLAVPLSGWWLTSAAGVALQWFGLFEVPAIAARDQALSERAGDLHELLFWALATLALLHAAMAVHHHLFAGDATLARMLPRGWLNPPAGQPRDRP